MEMYAGICYKDDILKRTKKICAFVISRKMPAKLELHVSQIISRNNVQSF